jgi:hypothetical protein
MRQSNCSASSDRRVGTRRSRAPELQNGMISFDCSTMGFERFVGSCSRHGKSSRKNPESGRFVGQILPRQLSARKEGRSPSAKHNKLSPSYETVYGEGEILDQVKLHAAPLC